MLLKNRLLEDLKNAMKAGDQNRVGVLRFLNSAIHNKEIEKRSKSGASELTEEEILAVVMSEAKKRRESIEIFRKGSRSDLAEKEEQELSIIQSYLPKQLGLEEIEKEIDVILQKNPNLSNFGLAMKEVMKFLKGKADAAVVSEILKKKFEK